MDEADAAPANTNGAVQQVSRLTWFRMLLARIGALAAAVYLLTMSGTAAWNSHVLNLRGEPRQGSVVDVDRTSWNRADRADVAVEGTAGSSGSNGPNGLITARVTTPRKDLDVGDRVALIVDPRDPRRAALSGDGWPWRQVLIPLMGLPLAAIWGVRFGRLPRGPRETEPKTS